jgi:5,10-methylenetetrahydromethanopterin reductase
VIQPGFDWCARMVSGTVVEAGETVESPRVQDAGGPWFLTGYHALWERDRAVLAGLPGSAEWIKRIEAERPEGERHLAVHEGHLVTITDRDRPLLEVAAALMPMFHWVGPAEDLQSRVNDVRAQGANEIIYFAAGADICREFKAFAEMMRGAR